MMFPCHGWELRAHAVAAYIHVESVEIFVFVSVSIKFDITNISSRRNDAEL
jgi:hypothetical protein